MDKAELRLWREIIATLRSVCDQIKSAQHDYKTGHDKEKQALPIESWPDSPLPLPVSISEYYETEKCNRNSGWQKIKKFLEIGGVASAVVIAAFTVFTFWQVKRQADATRKANDLTQRQWETQNRPWVGLSGDVVFPKPPTFQVFQSATPLNTGVDLEWTFNIKNAGLSPAFKTASDTQVLMATDNLQPPTLQMQFACRNADWRAKQEGSVLFPSSAGITVNSPAGMGGVVGSFQIEITKIRRIWMMTCISYQGQANEAVHHTKFWIVSNKIPDLPPPEVIERRAIVTFYRLPITGWGLMKAEAD